MLSSAASFEGQQLDRNFVAMLAHELRSPLSAAIGAIFLLRRKLLASMPQAGTDIQELFRIQSDALKTVQIVLERVVQLESLERAPAPVETDLAACVQGWRRHPASSLANPRVELQLDLPPGYRAPTAPRMIQTLVEELVSNALRFSSESSFVAVAIKAQPATWTIAVIDLGRGIPAEALARLGEAFFRADNVADLPGAGLGLAMVRRIAAVLGATIAWESRQGSTRCLVTFPNPTSGGCRAA